MNIFAPQTRSVTCPFCFETIDVFIDMSAGNQNYIEDCQVCCKPMKINIHIDSTDPENVSIDAERDE